MFAIVVDGKSDVTHREQEAISIRYVDENLKPDEIFMGFYNVGQCADGQSLAMMVFDVLLRSNLPVGMLRSQTYDGAANMAGDIQRCTDCCQNSTATGNVRALLDACRQLGCSGSD